MTTEWFDALTSSPGVPEPHTMEQLEAQARVFIARLLRVRLRTDQPIDAATRETTVDAAKREVTVQVRHARRLAQEEAAMYIHIALDHPTLAVLTTFPPELLRALQRINALANLCRGPNSESDR